jgi:hypothetical protein
MKLFITTKSLSLSLFFVSYLLLGIFTYQDYGISIDEPAERTTGAVTLHHLDERYGTRLLKNSQNFEVFRQIKFEQYPDRIYGVLFTAPAVYLEGLFNIGANGDTGEIYRFRHLLNFIVVYFGAIAVYLLAARRFDDWRWGLLCSLALILSPRFFAESFYNSKDLVLMAFFAIAMNGAIAFILSPNKKIAILAGSTAAICIDIRIAGIMLPAIMLLLFSLKYFQNKQQWLNQLKSLSVYFLTLVVSVVALWPYLWDSPYSRFIEAYQQFSHFSRANMDMLFFGEKINSTKVPWFYIPAWILLTTPILYLVFFIIGLFASLKDIIKKVNMRSYGDAQIQDTFFALIFFIPIFAVIILNSVVYDGWRHLYFIYPAFLLFVIHGIACIVKLTTKFKLQWVIYAVLTFSFSQIAFLMAKSHPLQSTFFNAFAGTNLKQRFELDYWALSSKDILEFILSNDDRPYIKVFANGQFSIEGSKLILNRDQGGRIIPTNLIMDADYAITNYRNPILNLSDDPAFSTFQDLKIGSEIIATSYKRIDSESIHNVINKEMQFNNLRPYAPNYLVSGWGSSEPWGTWSSGKGAKLALNLPSNGAKHLTLNLRALVNGNHPYQKVAVSIDGQKPIDFLLSKFDSNILTIDIPTSSGPSKITVLKFDLPNAISPKDIGIDSTDSRLIAIGLVSVKFY